MTEIFGSALPGVVTAAFATTFVSMMSVGNLSGRIFWGSVSDKIGRKNAFYWIWGLPMIFYCTIPWSAHAVAEGGGVLPLAVFYTSTLGIMSCFGATAATVPAYVNDL